MNSDCSVRILNSACDEINSQIQFQLHSRGFANCMHARFCAARAPARADRARDGGPEATMGARCPTTLRSLHSPVTTARCCPYRCGAAVRSSQRTGRSSMDAQLVNLPPAPQQRQDGSLLVPIYNVVRDPTEYCSTTTIPNSAHPQPMASSGCSRRQPSHGASSLAHHEPMSQQCQGLRYFTSNPATDL